MLKLMKGWEIFLEDIDAMDWLPPVAPRCSVSDVI